MKEFRLGKNFTEHYTDFSQLKAKKDQKKTIKEIAEKKEAAEKKVLPVCKYCGQRMGYMGGNIAVCKNEKCKGKPIVYVDAEIGNKTTKYVKPVYSLLKNRDIKYLNRVACV